MHIPCISKIFETEESSPYLQQKKPSLSSTLTDKKQQQKQKEYSNVDDEDDNIGRRLDRIKECYTQHQTPSIEESDFTVPVDDVMDFIERFVIVGKNNDIATRIQRNDCDQLQNLADNEFVLYNVNCFDDEIDVSSLDDNNRNESSILSSTSSTVTHIRPHQFYRTQDWWEHKTNESLKSQL